MAVAAGRSTRSLGVMKQQRENQLSSRLSESEARLRALLEKVLPRASRTGERAFFNSANLPNGYPRSLVPVEAEEMFQLASECCELREQLNEPLIGTVAQLYLSACREASSKNEHRRGPRQLATWLLAEIENS
jgi:hypothetical protein